MGTPGPISRTDARRWRSLSAPIQKGRPLSKRQQHAGPMIEITHRGHTRSPVLVKYVTLLQPSSLLPRQAPLAVLP